MDELRKSIRYSLIGTILCLLIFVPCISADDFGNLWGRVTDTDHHPLPNSQISLFLKEQGFEKILHTDSEGLFSAAGLPLGKYTLQCEAEGYKTQTQDDVHLDPSQSLYVRVVLSPVDKQQASSSRVLRLDYSSHLHQTLLDDFQINRSPSAHDVWSLVENQDLSATTNRIDVGGLWGAVPSLFSSRGASSWTQNIYLLNGLEVTDPYWTGRPLFLPDFYALRFTQLISAGNPPSALSPGAYFNILTQDGTDTFRGGLSAFFIHDRLQSSNITPALESEGMNESHSFNHLTDGNFHFSGPLIPKKLYFFSSLSASRVSRDIAEFDEEDLSTIKSGLLSLKYTLPENSFHLLWTGQNVDHSSYGAGREIPFSATSDRKEIYNIIQGIWKTRINDIHFIKTGISFAHGDIRSGYQEGASGQHGVEMFRRIPSATAPFAGRDRRSSLTLQLKGESCIPGFFKARHRLQYGLQAQYSHASSRKEIKDNLHLHFFNGLPVEVIRYNTPVQHRESGLHLSLFAQDSIILSNFISFYLGLHLSYDHGWLPSQTPNTVFSRNGSSLADIARVTWFSLSPRIGIIFPLSRSRGTALKVSVARYYFTLPLHYLTYGSSSALGGRAYAWNDLNMDNQFQESESGALLRREGPFFTRIDADLKRPYTNEFSISFVHTFGSGWSLTVGGFYRENRNLIETLNTGVPFSAYQPVQFFDSGDDRIADTHDDLEFTVYNQNIGTLGQDLFLLTNPDSGTRVSKYHGFDVTLVKRYSSKFIFFLSLTATSAEGSTSPGNTEWENDDGIIGTLYDNPNTLINSLGRMRFDRAYTGRIGLSWMAPFGIRIGCVIKYYDGQPFARKIIVTGMNQGPFFIQAHPRGVSRYEYNRTVDIRLEKRLTLGKTSVRVILDAFNLLNRGLATEENEWTGPEYPLRYATEIQSPRVFRLGLVYEF